MAIKAPETRRMAMVVVLLLLVSASCSSLVSAQTQGAAAADGMQGCKLQGHLEGCILGVENPAENKDEAEDCCHALEDDTDKCLMEQIQKKFPAIADIKERLHCTFTVMSTMVDLRGCIQELQNGVKGPEEIASCCRVFDERVDKKVAEMIRKFPVPAPFRNLINALQSGRCQNLKDCTLAVENAVKNPKEVASCCEALEKDTDKSLMKLIRKKFPAIADIKKQLQCKYEEGV